MEGEKWERAQKSEELSLGETGWRYMRLLCTAFTTFCESIIMSKQNVLFLSQRNWFENTLSGYSKPNFCWVSRLQPAMAIRIWDGQD